MAEIAVTIKRLLATLALCLFLTSLLGILLYLFPNKKGPPSGREVKDERVVDIVDSIKKKAKISEKVRIFATPGSLPVGAVTFRGGMGDEVFIVTGEEPLQKWPDEALKGLFAHELSHLSLGHLDTIFTGKRDFEAEADAEAIKLVGKDALRLCFQSHVEDRLDKAEKILQK